MDIERLMVVCAAGFPDITAFGGIHVHHPSSVCLYQFGAEGIKYSLRFPVDTRSVIPVIPVHSGCDIFDTVVQS